MNEFERNMERHRRMMAPLVGGSPHARGKAVRLGWSPPGPSEIYFDDMTWVKKSAPTTNYYGVTPRVVTASKTGTTEDVQLILKAEKPFTSPRVIDIPATSSTASVSVTAYGGEEALITLGWFVYASLITQPLKVDETYGLNKLTYNLPSPSQIGQFQLLNNGFALLAGSFTGGGIVNGSGTRLWCPIRSAEITDPDQAFYGIQIWTTGSIYGIDPSTTFGALTLSAIINDIAQSSDRSRPFIMANDFDTTWPV